MCESNRYTTPGFTRHIGTKHPNFTTVQVPDQINNQYDRIHAPMSAVACQSKDFEALQAYHHHKMSHKNSRVMGLALRVTMKAVQQRLAR